VPVEHSALRVVAQAEQEMFSALAHDPLMLA
jgi:hypothetical protein